MTTPTPKIVIDGSAGANVYGPPAPAVLGGQPVPQTVWTTWDSFATALGITAPRNLQRARAAIRHIPGSGR